MAGRVVEISKWDFFRDFVMYEQTYASELSRKRCAPRTKVEERREEVRRRARAGTIIRWEFRILGGGLDSRRIAKCVV